MYGKSGKDGTRTKYQIWSRTIDFVNHDKQEAVRITQVWENGDTIVHTAQTVCRKSDFRTLYHEYWWKNSGKLTFGFESKTATVNNVPVSEKDTAKNAAKRYAAFKKATEQDFLNWHLDLEVFPTFPYRKGRTFLVNFYDPGFSEPKLQVYTVTGNENLSGFDGQQTDCWILRHTSPNNEETFWISKKTKEVLKLEQKFNGNYRDKIKLRFAS